MSVAKRIHHAFFSLREFVSHLLRALKNLFFKADLFSKIWKNQDHPEATRVENFTNTKPLTRTFRPKKFLTSEPNKRALPHSLQITRIIFEKMGLNHVPGKLIGMLKETGPADAIEKFLNNLGYDQDILIRDPYERASLNKILECLIDVDFLALDHKFSDHLFYKIAKQRDFATLQKKVEKLNKVIELKNAYSSQSSSIFPEFIEEFKDFEDLDNWDALTDKEIDKKYAILRENNRLREIYNEYCDNIKNFIYRIDKLTKEGKIKEEHNDIFQEYAGSFRILMKRVEKGSLTSSGSENWPQEIDTIFNIFIQILEENEFNPFDEGSKDYASQNEEPGFSFEKCMDVLRLTYHPEMTFKFVESAYKKLIMKHHPDRNPSDEKKATEITIDLNIAWGSLTEHFKHKFKK